MSDLCSHCFSCLCLHDEDRVFCYTCRISALQMIDKTIGNALLLMDFKDVLSEIFKILKIWGEFSKKRCVGDLCESIYALLFDHRITVKRSGTRIDVKPNKNLRYPEVSLYRLMTRFGSKAVLHETIRLRLLQLGLKVCGAPQTGCERGLDFGEPLRRIECTAMDCIDRMYPHFQSICQF